MGLMLMHWGVANAESQCKTSTDTHDEGTTVLTKGCRNQAKCQVCCLSSPQEKKHQPPTKLSQGFYSFTKHLTIFSGVVLDLTRVRWHCKLQRHLFPIISVS